MHCLYLDSSCESMQTRQWLCVEAGHVTGPTDVYSYGHGSTRVQNARATNDHCTTSRRGWSILCENSWKLFLKRNIRRNTFSHFPRTNLVLSDDFIAVPDTRLTLFYDHTTKQEMQKSQIGVRATCTRVWHITWLSAEAKQAQLHRPAGLGFNALRAR